MADNDSDVGRNIIFILTGVGTAICVGLVVCCLCILLKRRRERQSEIRMEILPRSQKLIDGSVETPSAVTFGPTTRIQYRNLDQPIPGPAFRSPSPFVSNGNHGFDSLPRSRPMYQSHNMMTEAVADIGNAIPPQMTQEQPRMQNGQNGREPPPPYQALFTPP